MPRYKMSDVVVEINERENNPAESKYERFVGLEHYVSGEVIIRNFGSTERLESTMKVFQSGDILVARRNVYLKRAATVDFDGLTSGDSIVLRPTNYLIGRILPFVLNTDAFWDFADRYSDGTMSKRLSPKTLMKYEFDLPNDDELSLLADTLWAANDTREAYQELLRQSDELVKSQFIELSEKSGGKPTRMGDIASYVNGAEFKPRDWSLSGKPIIRIQNLNDPSATFNYFSGTIDSKYLVQKGDILISWATHLEAYIWNGDEAWLNQHIFKVVFDKTDIDKTFFLFAANVASKEAFKKAHGFKASMEHIKRGDFEDAVVYLPDLDTQKQFAIFAHQLDKSK